MFRNVLLLLALLHGVLASPAGGFAQTADARSNATSVSSEPAPEKIDQLIRLLDDPGVKAWLAEQRPSAPVAETQGVGSDRATDGMQKSMVSSSLDEMKAHVMRIAQAWTRVPEKFARLRSVLSAELSDRGGIGIVLVTALFIGVGTAASYVVFRMTRSLRLWTIAQPRDTPQGRVRKLGGRFLVALLLVCGFVLGSAGAFLLFDWPPLLREIVLAFLTAAIVVWTSRALAAVLLLPSFMRVAHAREVRAFDIDDRRAEHWYRWTVALVAVCAVIAAVLTLLPRFGFDDIDILALAVPADLALLAFCLAAVWTRPPPDVVGSERHGGLGHVAGSWLLTAYLVALLIIRTSGSFVLFWIAFAALLLPAAIVAAHRGVRYVLRPPDAETGARPVSAVAVAVVDRGIRMALILVAAYLLARVWGLDMVGMETTSPGMALILRGVLSAAVIALAADFAWSIIKAVVERKIGADEPLHAAGDETRRPLDPHQARLRTLLPIVQNILLAAITVIAVLMILASLGIQIGPLIAGAGVVGVAIGFGAQTLVKDIISGVFYLFDDAFRVGEYITSGKYMGTVESFSLRSVKLRHHRGPLFTIPFGELGAVQNQSRDWVTDKFNLTVGYDTDLELARKLIKKLGIELAEDPEFAPYVIEPIKMQGVQKFGDYGIEIRIKLTTKPGEAFSMKRRFYVRIREIFKEKGIELPLPTVHVQGSSPVSSDVEAAVSQTHINQRNKAAAEVPPEG